MVGAGGFEPLYSLSDILVAPGGVKQLECSIAFGGSGRWGI